MLCPSYWQRKISRPDSSSTCLLAVDSVCSYVFVLLAIGWASTIAKHKYLFRKNLCTFCLTTKSLIITLFICKYESTSSLCTAYNVVIQQQLSKCYAVLQSSVHV